MSKVFQIFLRDLKRILHNPVAIVVTIGVALIPSLYAWCNILANWDPYGNTSTMAVAVVNEDEGCDLEGVGHVDVGAQVVEKLKDNHQLGWRFLSKEEALDQVRSGASYAAIVIPPHFSADLTSVVSGHLAHPTLDYYVNEKLNAVAPKVTDAGATSVENQIDSNFVSTVSTVVTEKLKGVVGGATDGAASGVSQASKDVAAAQESLSSLQSTIDGTRSTCAAGRDAVAQAKDGLASLSGVVEKGQGTLRDTLGDLARVRSEAQKLNGSLSQALAGATSDVGSLSATANHGIGALAGNLGKAQGRLDTALARLQSAQQNLQQAHDRLAEAQAAMPEDTDLERQVKTSLGQAVQSLGDTLSTQQAILDKVKALDGSVAQGASELEGNAQEANDALGAASKNLTDLGSTLQGTTMVELSQAMDDLATSGGDLQGALAGAGPLIGQAQSMLDSLDHTLAEADGALGTTKESLGTVQGSLATVATDLSAVTSSATFEQLRSVMGLDVKDVAEAMGHPVEIENQSVFPVANYGSGVAPFYTNLALFVGGFVLVAIYKLEVDHEGIGEFKPWQGYFGRGLLLLVIGELQALVCCVGDLALGIQCLSPAGFVFAGLVESFVYVNLIYALSVAFKHIGKALAVLIVILQIPGSSGLYPIQMQPQIFQAIYPWLPFTYGNNAMRECIAGFYDGYYVHNLLMLLLFLIPSLIIGVGLRRWLLNINGLFDRKLAETDLMICERDPAPQAHFRLATILAAAMDNRAYFENFKKRAATFELAYPTLIRVGFICLFLVPCLLLIPMFIVQARGPMFVLWIVGTLLIITFLIVVEYFHDRFQNETDLGELDHQQLLALADLQISGKPIIFPYALGRAKGTRGSLNTKTDGQSDGKDDGSAGEAPSSTDKANGTRAMDPVDADGDDTDDQRTRAMNPVAGTSPDAVQPTEVMARVPSDEPAGPGTPDDDREDITDGEDHGTGDDTDGKGDGERG